MEMKCDNYIALLGLGAIGMPLAYMLSKKLGDQFVVLSDEKHAQSLTHVPIMVNSEQFSPKLICKKEQLDRPITALFVCVKNYSLESSLSLIKNCVDRDTVIIPLQNGVFSFSFFRRGFVGNVVLEGFAQGPNTIRRSNTYTYSETGVYHIGSSITEWKAYAQKVYELLRSSGINCYYDEDIKHEVWKKFMLNVAGNALTALTQIDYNMFSLSKEAQHICRSVMKEFATVAYTEGVIITDDDIDDVMNYFIHYTSSKHTSMLEDVIHQRRTENDYIAGHIVNLAAANGISVPFTTMLYELMKIREDVYMGNLYVRKEKKYEHKCD